ncbi:MAG: ribosomal RNA small subunit methyltransferase A [Candidatus Moraniibacteriota bacterium]|nr:MAG: ribosomal RNA small subunit methyltransferase A [Candidatus Moranbacteria bacterium]
MKKFEHKKSLGQNFLKNDVIIDRIVSDSDVNNDDVVIEIGSGQGVLTEKLAQKAKKVIAIELDNRLIPFLIHRFEKYENVEIVHGDILHMNMPALLAEHGVSRYCVVANIPYYITAPIIRLFLESTTQPEKIVLMVQKEVAERITATAGEMSLLAVSAQYYAECTYLFTVPRTEFDPVPDVDSAVIALRVKKHTATSEYAKQFFRVVKIGFSAKRKTLLNNLANGLQRNKDDIEMVLEKCSFSANVRAQELSLDQWKNLEKLLRDE